MTDKELHELLDEETAASEADRVHPVGGGTIQRPNRNRSVVFSVRLNADEVHAVQRRADSAGLPTSTLVRSWIVERIRAEDHTSDLRGVLASLRRDLERAERLAS